MENYIYNTSGQFTPIQTPYEAAVKAKREASNVSVNTHTYVVRVKAGYVGQVVLSGDGEVLWESNPRKTREKALKAADAAHVQGVRNAYANV